MQIGIDKKAFAISIDVYEVPRTVLIRCSKDSTYITASATGFTT